MRLTLGLSLFQLRLDSKHFIGGFDTSKVLSNFLGFLGVILNSVFVDVRIQIGKRPMVSETTTRLSFNLSLLRDELGLDTWWLPILSFYTWR